MRPAKAPNAPAIREKLAAVLSEHKYFQNADANPSIRVVLPEINLGNQKKLNAFSTRDGHTSRLPSNPSGKQTKVVRASHRRDTI